MYWVDLLWFIPFLAINIGSLYMIKQIIKIPPKSNEDR